MEWRIRSRGSGWHVTRILLGVLEPKVEKLAKNVQMGKRSEQTSVPETFDIQGCEGEAPGRFASFLKKNSYFSAIWITFRTCLEPFETTKFLRFESQLKKLNCSVFSLLTGQV